jgi:ribosomal protein S12 methylthiotransferase
LPWGRGRRFSPPALLGYNKRMTSFCLISLGCPKNTADSEGLAEGLAKRGVLITDDAEEADILAVNTCGFIEDAKRESIDEILRLAGLKTDGKRLIVLGCLSERYGEELKREMPEIDALFGVGEEEKVIDYCAGGAGKVSHVVLPNGNFAASCYRYVKVSEGCGRRCSFCVIPSIRGPHKSREPREILRDAEAALRAGAKELVLVAQDITAYGKDWKSGGLPGLLRDLASIEGDFWIRLLYLHPAGIDDALLEAMAEEDKVVKYVDVPLQHSEDRVLSAMRRAGGTRKEYLRLMVRIRKALPGVALRTAFIVGFPGETERDFQGLLDFVEEVRFDRLGAFAYSREEGTAAASMKPQVPREVKERRLEELMRVQAEISLEKNRELVGRRFRALVDAAGAEEALGRIYSQAPEIDGHTIIKGAGIEEGGFLNVEITEEYDNDLAGKPS